MVIVDPPFEDGALKATDNCALPEVILVIEGADGVPRGVTEFEYPDSLLEPFAFVAMIVNLYAVPFVKPVTVLL